MGYTHSFAAIQPIEMGKWLKITEAFEQVIKNLPDTSSSAGGYFADKPLRLKKEYDVEASPVLSSEEIRFNGAGEYGHETFLLIRRARNESSYCKTNRKPYDLAVCAALILTHKFAPGHRAISSDGDPSDWLPSLELCKKVLDMTDLVIPPGVTMRGYDYVKMEPVEPWWKMSDSPVWF